MAKRSSKPRVAYPEVNAQVRDLVRVVVIVAPLVFVLPSWRHETYQELYVKVSHIPSA